MRLAVQYQEEEGEPPSPRAVRRMLKAAIASSAEITVRFVASKDAQALNRRFRSRRYIPDVLAFPLPAKPGAVAGDIAACPKVIERDAAAAGIPERSHYARVLVHAALHLLGHTHDKLADAARMRKAETDALSLLGVPNPHVSAMR